jgi:hypothetical protein
MDIEELNKPCINCGRTTHRILFGGRGRGVCGSSRLPGYEPSGCARWDTTDALGEPTTRYVRAYRNPRAAAAQIGPWSFVQPDGRPLPEDPPRSRCSGQRSGSGDSRRPGDTSRHH